MIRIAIAEDKRIIRNSLVEGLSEFDFIKIVFTSENGSEFLERIKECADHEIPEIVLMDIDMPVMDGIATIAHAKVIYPQVEFLVLTVFDEEEKIFEAVKAGASGYLLKDEQVATIAGFIQQVKEFRAVPMSPAIARKALRLLTSSLVTNEVSTSAPESRLSTRETEVLRLLVEGLDHRKIAERLGVSHFTVRNQITSIYRKLHVTCKVDAVKLAILNKLV